MDIPLPQELKQFVQDSVQSGLYPDEADVIRDALFRLRQVLRPVSRTSDRGGKITGLAEPPLSPTELNQRLLESGLVLDFPNPADDSDDPEDLPIESDGEPLSEMIIRERR